MRGTGHAVQGNYIGTDVTGTLDLGNAQYGVVVAGSNITIGGTMAAARNIISGNDFSGIVITGAGTVGNVVSGNYIGTDLTGTVELARISHWVDATRPPVFA